MIPPHEPLRWQRFRPLTLAIPAVALAVTAVCFVWPAVLGVGSSKLASSTEAIEPSRTTGPAAGSAARSLSTPSLSPMPSTTSPRASAAAAPSATLVKRIAKSSTTTKKLSAKHFRLKRPGAALPSGAQCATAVRAVSIRENKKVNKTANHTMGHRIPGADAPITRVDGKFTGTTEQILRWAACKWGVNEDMVKAQAAVESWWHMDNKGDLGTDPARCPAGHGLGVDGTDGKCPESYGMMQVRYPYNKTAFPAVITSTAMNVDYMYSVWRSCYEGQMTWLNTVERGSQYAAGDAWGCAGVWFSGRWHNAGANGYITRVKDYRSQQIWKTANFQQP
ncbi:MAG TPA: hypothetical protein VLL08_19480 [Kineosporiaceae bacterium]|nr:hypothetical protein [Kineosporiaceae bacterium]